MNVAARRASRPAERASRSPGAKTYRLLLNTTFSAPQAWLLLAQDRGYFEQEGVALDLTTGEGAYSAAPRMALEGFDLAFGDANSLIELAAAETGAPLVGVFMLFQASPSAIAVKRDGPIHAPSDLQGRTILGYANDVALRTFGPFCLSAGIERTGVKWRRFDGHMPDQVRHLLASDENDGVFGYVSTISAALAAGGVDPERAVRFLRYADYAPELYGSCIMASQRMIREEPAALTAILRAVDRGVRDMLSDSEAALDAVARRDPNMARGAEALRLATTLELEMGGLGARTRDLGDVDDERLTQAIALMVEGAKLKRTPALAEVFTRQFLPSRAAAIAAARR